MSKNKVYVILDKVSAGWRERRAEKQTKNTSAALKQRGVIYGTVRMSCGFSKEELAKLPF